MWKYRLQNGGHFVRGGGGDGGGESYENAILVLPDWIQHIFWKSWGTVYSHGLTEIGH